MVLWPSTFLHESGSTEWIIVPDCSWPILSLHALAFHLAVKILLQIFSVWRFEHVGLTYICLPFSRMLAGTALCYATTIKWKYLIFDINHQQNMRVRPDWNDKNDNANYAPSYHMEGFTNGSGCHFLWRNIRSSAKDLDCELFYFELKRHNVSHYIYVI